MRPKTYIFWFVTIPTRTIMQFASNGQLNVVWFIIYFECFIFHSGAVKLVLNRVQWNLTTFENAAAVRAFGPYFETNEKKVADRWFVVWKITQVHCNFAIWSKWLRFGFEQCRITRQTARNTRSCRDMSVERKKSIVWVKVAWYSANFMNYSDDFSMKTVIIYRM